MTENEFEKIETLLKQVSRIRKRAYKEAELKGENFNIFQVLKLQTNEVKLHTRLIINLLNPNGKHGLGTKPLEFFIKILLENDERISKKEDLIYTNFKGATVHNKYLGKKDKIEGKHIGGDIDIFIKMNGVSIAIENKINADDQKNQLIRYYNSLELDNINSLLFYLTLDGKSPSFKSVKDELEEGIDYYLLSYEKHILPWLILCASVAFDKPILRETIRQYIILIKKLTGQLTNQQMEKELLGLILKDYESSKLIKKNFTKALDKLKDNILERVFENLEAENYLLSYDKKKIILDAPNAPHLWIYKNKWREGLVVCLEHVKGKSIFEFGIVNYGEALNSKERKELISNKNLKKSIKWIDSKQLDIDTYNFENVSSTTISLSEKLTEILIKIVNDEKINWVL